MGGEMIVVGLNRELSAEDLPSLKWAEVSRLSKKSIAAI